MPLGFAKSMLSTQFAAGLGARSSAATLAQQAGDGLTFLSDDGVANGSARSDGGKASGASHTITVNPADSGFYFHKSDSWTVEWFMKFSATFDNSTQKFLAINRSDDNIAFSMSSGSNTTFAIYTDFTQRTTTSLHTDYKHYAVVCDGSNNVAAYQDGTRLFTNAYANTNIERTVEVGFQGQGVVNIFFDSIKITDGAKYSGTSFTAPTTELINESNTLALFNFVGGSTSDDTE